VFGFVPLSAMELATVVVIVGGYILATEVAKAWVFRSEEALLSASLSVSEPGGGN
jgi:hypothetical protein